MGTVLVGIIVGLVLGLTGAGGSVFALPLIVSFLGLALSEAIGLSLGAVAVSAIFGTLLRLRHKDIQWQTGLIFAILGAPLTPVGLTLNQTVPPQWVFLAFTILVVVIATRLWQQAGRSPESAKQLRAAPNQHTSEDNNATPTTQHWSWRNTMSLIAGALTSGLLSGFFGVGGGFIIVPILIQGLNIPIKQAVATSLAIISVISTSGFLAFLTSGPNLSHTVLSQISIGGLIGMSLGVALSRYLAGPTLQRLFAVTMILVAMTTFLKEYVF